MKWDIFRNSINIVIKKWVQFEKDLLDFNQKNPETKINIDDTFNDFVKIIIKLKLNFYNVFLNPYSQGMFDFENHSHTIIESDNFCHYALQRKIVNFDYSLCENLKDRIVIFGLFKKDIMGKENIYGFFQDINNAPEDKRDMKIINYIILKNPKQKNNYDN